MPRPTWIVLTVSLAATLLVACQSPTPLETARNDGWNHYGSTESPTGTTVALGAIAGGESDVIAEGVITDVCEKKGCWMRVSSGEEELFVRFRDYAFFVPMNAAGHRVVMQGDAVAEEVTVEMLRHYAQDAGKSPAEIAAITETETRVTFYADSVYIAGAGLDTPHDE